MDIKNNFAANGDYLTDWPTNNKIKRVIKNLRYQHGKKTATKLNKNNKRIIHDIKLLNRGKCFGVNEIKVSIIIPAYNAEKFILETIECCLQQSHKNIEIIIVDDESTDQTVKLIKDLNNEKIVLSTQTNSGPGIARNNGVKNAKGKYLFFLDADDYIPEYAIESLLLACYNLDSDFAIGKTLRKHLDVDHMAYFWMPENYKTFRISNLEKETNLFKDTNVHNRIYLKQFWIENNFEFEKCLYEDKLLSFDIWTKAKKVAIVDNFTYQWSVRGEGSSITNNKDKNNFLNRVYVINKLLEKDCNNTIRKELEKFTIEQDLKVSVENWNNNDEELKQIIFSEFVKINSTFKYNHQFADQQLEQLVLYLTNNDYESFNKLLIKC